MGTLYLVDGVTPATLQSLYDAAPTPPQLIINSTPDPLTLRGSVAGGLFSIEDSGSTERLRVDDSTGDALLELISTTQGFRPPTMTEVQRDAIASPTQGLVVYNTDDSALNQYDGATWTIPGAGLTTLQGAYDNDPTGAQILLDATPNPITIQASVTGTVFEAQDLAGNPILNVSADPDMVEVAGQLTVDDAFLNAGAVNSIVLSDTFTTGGPFVGGGLLSNGTVTYNNSVFIWALLQESKTYAAAAGPGFAAFTLFNALARIENSGNFDLVQALTLNVGVVHARTTSGTSVIAANNGVNFAAQLRGEVSGAIATRTNCNMASVSPTYSVVAGATVNLGTIRGMQFSAPAIALFGSGAGTANITAYYGMDFANSTFGGASATISVVRSLLNSGTNKRFLDHTGTAQSRLGGQLLFTSDLTGVTYGAGADMQTGWAGANFYFWQFNGTTNQLRWSNPASGQFLAAGNTPASDQMLFDFAKMAFLQSASVGNQKVIFATKAESITIAGEFSQYLLTQSANDTIDAALTLYAGWTINTPSPVLGTGSLTSQVGLNIGGNPSTASVNRVGLRILSNPSGGSGINAALWVTAGLSRFDGRVDINQPIALGGGAAATLGTIGGSGPTAAAQAQWVEIDVNGVAHWIPAWT